MKPLQGYFLARSLFDLNRLFCDATLALWESRQSHSLERSQN